jgi:long-chain acyl-CoA synthetase
LRLADVAAEGRRLAEEQPELYKQLRTASQPEDIATLIYTSGTTGDPKGVMLTHKNLAANATMNYRWLRLEGRRDVALSYLPLSHIFERGVWYTNMCAGSVVAYAESIDTVARNLTEVRPTVMTSVPRMFEKIYARIVERGTAARFPRRQIFLWSLDVGRSWAKVRNRGGKPGLWLSLKHRVADLLVFKKWREAMGGRIRCFISGGAPLAPELGYLFTGAGLPILEGYGLTETSPSISCNTEERTRIGTVGPIIEGVSVEIAPDGEVLVKGDNVMAGYYNRPDANREAFTEDGWFRTGDIGYINSDGFLVITDRKKDLIKTSGGKYVAPQPIESMIKSSRFVSQVVVVGNNRKFASALICPNLEMLRSYATLKGISYSGDDQLLRHRRIISLMERQVEKYTAGLARFEKIKKVALLDHELTVEAGELTPTLKPRRAAIERKYGLVIDAMYEEAEREVAVV